MEVPVPASNYRNLSVNKERLFWTDSADEKTKLVALDIGNKEI